MAQALEEMVTELTCSICLRLFNTPVTIPCGHNFCSDCLELTWKDKGFSAYTCPQCWATFSIKPEFKKNILLSNLVGLAQDAKGLKDSSDQEEEEEEEKDGGKTDEELEGEDEEAKGTVMCDNCRKVPAAKTCLTCMAAFCSFHLLPHIKSPAFANHQMTLPLRDLQKRKCPEHNKLIDHYCWEHGKCICCYCVLNHKACQTYNLEEGKKKKELLYTNTLRSLNQKIDKATSTTEELQYEQGKVMVKIRQKKELLESEFGKIKALIDEEWKIAVAKINTEEKKVTQKFSHSQKVSNKKKKEFELLKGKVQSLLQEQDDLQFLQRATKLKDTTPKEPPKLRIELEEKLLQNIYTKATSLKETVKLQLSQSEETPEQKPSEMEVPEVASGKIGKKMPEFQPGATKPDGPTKKPSKKSKPQKTPCPDVSPDSREQLLKHAVKLLVDPITAHNKILMIGDFTKLAVSILSQNYPANPRRFVGCSQVLCTLGFFGGIHYWEVEKEGGNFCSFGVAYQSIPRSGPESRLGRNKVSWCLEWCNSNLQAWHDDKQTDLTIPKASRFGVLLNYNEGYLAFYCLGKKFSQIYKFRATFTEAVYPAFWMFSSDTILTLSQDYTMEP